MLRTRFLRTAFHHLLIGAFAWNAQFLFAQRQDFSPRDAWEWRTASDVRISSDGSRVLYVQEWNDRASNARCSSLHLATADGREDRALTSGPSRDFSPRWNEAGDRIAYLSNRSGRTRIWIRDVATNKETVLEGVKEEPLAITWAPRGDRIAFTAPAPTAAPPSWVPPAFVSLLRPAPRDCLPIYRGRKRRTGAAAGVVRSELDG